MVNHAKQAVHGRKPSSTTSYNSVCIASFVMVSAEPTPGSRLNEPAGRVLACLPWFDKFSSHHIYVRRSTLSPALMGVLFHSRTFTLI